MSKLKTIKPVAVLNITAYTCPMTFVKTKLKLEDLEPGDVLEVILRDGEPFRNVTRSCQDEGNRLLGAEKINPEHYRIFIEKGEE
ncbi:MAG: sulfurtransferase TusA family protein [bacterium]